VDGRVGSPDIPWVNPRVAIRRPAPFPASHRGCGRPRNHSTPEFAAQVALRPPSTSDGARPFGGSRGGHPVESGPELAVLPVRAGRADLHATGADSAAHALVSEVGAALPEP
jgi:hypothetical protein